jgi:neutral ceramidase
MHRAALLLAAVSTLAAADFRAGVARNNITPRESLWLSGYASRTRPAEGTLNELFAKALAIEDRKGKRVVIVTTDLIGLPRVITDAVAARLQKQYGLDRSQILFNSSHTHTGPVIRANLMTMYSLPAAQDRLLGDYARQLTEDLFTTAAAALGQMKPATLRYAQGTAGFAINRREPSAQGVRIGLNPAGPVDRSVPVLEALGQDGRPMAILFGYACHNTTLTGEHYKYSGDYAGFAQGELESMYPGATALFLMLCGGDANPNPRTKEENARAHGKELAAAVKTALDGAKVPVRGELRSAFQTINLNFRPHTREDFEKEAQSSNQFAVRRAREMLAAYDAGSPVRSTPYPVQAIRFGKDMTVVALGGEVVVDYALRAKREFPKERLVVAGYSNDVMCYIPSLRVLKEGGYEAESSMIYYGMPGPFTEDVEESIAQSIRSVLKRAGAK